MLLLQHHVIADDTRKFQFRPQRSRQGQAEGNKQYDFMFHDG
jgi:hypothetical protein